MLVVALLPVYRLFSIGRRRVLKFYKPAKNKLMAMVANRYLVHVIVVSIVFVAMVFNFQISNVRAESFGEKSLLHDLVAQNNLEIIEEYASDGIAVNYANSTYRDQIAVSSLAYGIEETVDNSDQINLVSGQLTNAITTTEKPSSAPRLKVEAYVVQSGDSLSSIANQFGILVNTLLWANDLSVNSVLQPGDSLDILPIDGIQYTISSGDTISSIASKYDISQDVIDDYNGISSADVLAIGDILLIPGGEKQVTNYRPSSSAITQIFSPPAQIITNSAPTATTATASSSGMVWPTDLHVITQYFGWSHNGLDIDCYYDNNNYAADDGYVTIAGWHSGYGYLVEIDHGNGIKTRYGHHASLYVKEGEYVAAGQAIGLCGTTGHSTGTHLHFEVIVNGVRKNPLEYIR